MVCGASLATLKVTWYETVSESCTIKVKACENPSAMSRWFFNPPLKRKAWMNERKEKKEGRGKWKEGRKKEGYSSLLTMLYERSKQLFIMNHWKFLETWANMLNQWLSVLVIYSLILRKSINIPILINFKMSDSRHLL